jgi:hypothetical protein
MPKFRKRPVEIEAWQFVKSFQNKPQWITDALNTGDVWYQGGSNPYFTIKTLEGEMRANEGDWIIRGVKGEIYPCKPDIFALTYQAA